MKRAVLQKSMLIFMAALLCFSIVAGAFPGRTAAAAETEAPGTGLVNPGFEMDLTESGDIPGWSVDPATKDYGSASISEEHARTGSRSLLFHDQTNGAQPVGSFRVLSDPIAVSQGSTVTFSVYVYKANDSDQTHGIQPVIHFYRESGTEITPNAFVNYGKTSVPVGQWFKLEVTATVPDQTAHVRVGLYSGFPSLTKVYADDASITIVSPDPDPGEEPSTPGDNPSTPGDDPSTPGNNPPDPGQGATLSNPGFEMDLTETGDIPGWSIDPATKDYGSISISEEYARTGSRSLLFHDQTNGAQPVGSFRVLSDPVAVSQGSTVTFSIFVYKVNAGDQTHGIQPVIHYYTASGEEIKPNAFVNYGSSIVPVGQWFKLEVTAAVPDQTAHVRVGLYSGFPSVTKVYADDAEITIVSPDPDPGEEPAPGHETTLVNPGFEMDLTESGDIPGWSVDPATKDYGSISISEEYARTGSRSLLFHDQTNGAQPVGSFRVLSDPIAVSQGSTVTFSIFVYKVNAGDQTHGIQPVIHFYRESGTEITPNAFVNYGNSIVPVGQWFKLEVTAAVPDQTAHVRVGLYSGFPSVTKVYADDASITIVSPGQDPVQDIPKELANPGFEEDLVNGSIPGWSLDPSTSGLVALSSDIKLSGSRSLYFKDDSTETPLRVLSDKVGVKPGDTLIVSANVYVRQQTHNIVTQIYYYNARDEQLKVNEALFSSNSLGSEKWSTMRLLTVVPENAAYARIALYSGAPSITEAYFDDIAITVMPEEKTLERQYQQPENLGDMVFVNLGQAGAIQTNANGENEVYFVTNGAPGTFYALDAETGKVKFKEVIPNTVATWAMTIGTDKNVYFSGTEDGKLYRYLPLEKKVEYLGYNNTDNWTWDLEAVDDKIYGATYNGATYGKVFEYDITNKTFRNYGAVEAGQQYVRGIAVDDKYIYAGLGTTIRLYKIDRVTGEKTEINIPGYSGETGTVADVFVLNGKLFVSVSTTSMVVMDLATGKIEAGFQYSNMISEPSPNDPDVIYFKYLTKFYKYDMRTRQTTEIELPYPLPDTTRVKDMAWIEMASGEKKGQTVLAMVTQYGEYILIDPEDKWMSFIELEIDAQPVNIQSLVTGFDGKLYLGGYQRGMSVYNPFTGKIEANISSFPQPEGIGYTNGYMYYGTYPGALIYKYDPSRPVELNQNPELVFDAEHQDRPFALAAGDGKLFIGTVPDYGYLGGSLIVHDEKTGTWKQFNHDEMALNNRLPVNNQSIIGLAYRDGKLYGSTSVWGGLGIDPTEEEAIIFVWDVAKEQLIDAFTLEGLLIDEKPRMIGSIGFGPDGLLWGIVDGTIFALDTDTKTVVKSKMIFPSMYNTSKWLPYRLLWAPDGMIYTTLGRKVVAVDPETLQYKIIVEQFVNNMTLGIDGSIYYSPDSGASLYRIAVPETDATLASLTVDGQNVESFSPGVLNYKLKLSPGAAIEAVPTQSGAAVTVDDQRDTAQKVYIRVTATDGKSTLTYVIENQADEPQPTDPERPGRPKRDSNAGGGAERPAADEGTLIVTAEEMKANEAGIIEIDVEGKNLVQLPANVSELANGQPVILKSGDLQIMLSPETLAQLQALVPESEDGKAGIVIGLETVEPAVVQKSVEAAIERYIADIRPASEARSIQVTATGGGQAADGSETPNGEMTVSFKLGDGIDPQSVAVYRLNGDGSITFVGGVVENGWIHADVRAGGTYVALEFNKSFDDVPETHWAHDAIRKLAARLIVSGVSGSSFAPDREVTRAEFVALIARALGLQADGNLTPFSDVDPDSWYAPAVAAAVNAGIVSGVGEDRFAPGSPITREEMAIVLVKAYAHAFGGGETAETIAPFTDLDQVHAWALESVIAAYQAGLVSGRGDGMFAPQETLTRAEAAQAVLNLLNRLQ